MKLVYSFLTIAAILLMSVTINAMNSTIEESKEIRNKVVVSQVERVDYRKIIDEKESEERVRFYKKEIECLTRNIYFEARGESKEGQTAVALVTLNRVFSDRYPDDVCGVVYDAKRYEDGSPKKNQCQFSWYCDDLDIDISNLSVYNSINRIAEFVYINYYLNRNAMKDTTNGSTHYHALHVDPYWSNHPNYELVANIGSHLFYRPTYE